MIKLQKRYAPFFPTTMRSSTESLVADLTAFCQSDSLSEGGLQEIVDYHGWQTGVDDISYDFFLLACRNEKVTEGILRYLLQIFPGAGHFVDSEGRSPLTHVCHNKNVTLGIVRLLLDACPDSVRIVDIYDGTPLSSFCCFAQNLDNEVAVDILKLLLERCPESVRHACYDGSLPIHLASGPGMKSPEFCRLLIEAFQRVPTQHHASEEVYTSRKAKKTKLMKNSLFEDLVSILRYAGSV